MFQRIAILGLGLIGSSIARAVRQSQPQVHIAAFDLSHEALAFASAHGFADSQHAHAGQAANGADLVILATPPFTLASLAADIGPFLKEGAIVTDVASVKRHAVAAITPHLGKTIHYVPGHPIAGSEKTGVTAGRADLFTGKRIVLTPEERLLSSDAVARVRDWWQEMGAQVEFMPADLHDRIYAYVSHLPQMVAFAAKAVMNGAPVQSDEARKFTRLMASDPALWAEICLANADYIDAAMDDFSSFACQIEGELSETPAEGGVDAQLAMELFPRVAATCLIAAVSILQETTGVHPARFAGTGFADMTAPARADTEATLAAISSHHWVVAKMLGAMLIQIKRIRNALQEGDRESLIGALAGKNDHN